MFYEIVRRMVGKDVKITLKVANLAPLECILINCDQNVLSIQRNIHFTKLGYVKDVLEYLTLDNVLSICEIPAINKESNINWINILIEAKNNVDKWDLVTTDFYLHSSHKDDVLNKLRGAHGFRKRGKNELAPFIKDTDCEYKIWDCNIHFADTLGNKNIGWAMALTDDDRLQSHLPHSHYMFKIEE